MILDLKRIFLEENQSLTVHTDVQISEMEINPTAFFTKLPFADITVTNRAGLVELKAECVFEYSFYCDRCTALSTKSNACKFSHILVVELPQDSDDDYIEAPDYKLDTDALLRDDILLELPSKFLCKKSCKGLCPKCGKNLNEGLCGCSRRETDPRLAVLQQLLSD